MRDTAAAILAAWADEANRKDDMIVALDAPMQALRTLLAGKPAHVARESGAPRKPREGTKQEQVVAMLRRPKGATVAQIAEAPGWAQHTVRGVFAGLTKKGHAVEVKSRERMVGPNKAGARGSHPSITCRPDHRAGLLEGSPPPLSFPRRRARPSDASHHRCALGCGYAGRTAKGATDGSSPLAPGPARRQDRARCRMHES